MVPRRSGTATITRWTFCFFDHLHQVSRHGFAGDRTFEFARPTDDLHSNLRILAQALHRVAGRARRPDHVNAFHQDRQLDQPAVAEPPSEKSQGHDEQAERRGTAAQQEIGTEIADAGHHERQQAWHHEQAEVEFPPGVQPGRIVEIEPMRAQQHDRGEYENLVSSRDRS